MDNEPVPNKDRRKLLKFAVGMAALGLVGSSRRGREWLVDRAADVVDPLLARHYEQPLVFADLHYSSAMQEPLEASLERVFPTEHFLTRASDGLGFISHQESAHLYPTGDYLFAVSETDHSVLFWHQEQHVWMRLLHEGARIHLSDDFKPEKAHQPFSASRSLDYAVKGLDTCRRYRIPHPGYIDSSCVTPFAKETTIPHQSIVQNKSEGITTEDERYVFTDEGTLLDIQHVKGFAEIALVTYDQLKKIQNNPGLNSEVRVFMAWTQRGILYSFPRDFVQPSLLMQTLTGICMDAVLRTEALSQLGAIDPADAVISRSGLKGGMTAEDLYSNALGVSTALSLLEQATPHEIAAWIDNRASYREQVMRDVIQERGFVVTYQDFQTDVRVFNPLVPITFAPISSPPQPLRYMPVSQEIIGGLKVPSTTILENAGKTISHKLPGY